MSEPHTVVIVGMGQLGEVFAEGFERLATRVVQVRRDDDVQALAARIPDPGLVLVTVGETELEAAVRPLPTTWKERIGLVQNELLPETWQALGIIDPTVAVVWFEKKAGRPLKVIRPTVLAGPARHALADALGTMDVDTRFAMAGEPLALELVAKNLYILTTNCAGLETEGTVGMLLSEHRALALAVAAEVLDVQEALVGHALDREDLLADLEAAARADPEHVCRGRSAPARLERLRARARARGVSTPNLDRIAAQQGS